MLKFTDFQSLKTPTDVILLQTNFAKSMLAYVPDEVVRGRLSSAVEMNAALATAFWDALYAYGDSFKSTILAK